MSNKPFNETARDLKLDEAAEENDDYILCGELQNDEGEWVAAEINLMKSLGCLNRLVRSLTLTISHAPRFWTHLNRSLYSPRGVGWQRLLEISGLCRVQCQSYSCSDE